MGHSHLLHVFDRLYKCYRDGGVLATRTRLARRAVQAETRTRLTRGAATSPSPGAGAVAPSASARPQPPNPQIARPLISVAASRPRGLPCASTPQVTPMRSKIACVAIALFGVLLAV